MGSHEPQGGDSTPFIHEVLRRVNPRIIRWTGGVAAGVGLLLLALNLAGFVMPLRSPLLTETFRDFSSPVMLSGNEALRRLENLDSSDGARFAVEANRIVSLAIAHVSHRGLDERSIRAFRYTVPPTENYILWILRYLKPDTYQFYEFTDYRRAVQRGVGLCGQQAMALVEYLHSRGFKAGIVQLTGHNVTTVEVAPGTWHILDPDFNVSIPYSLEAFIQDRALVERYYGDHPDYSPWQMYTANPLTVAFGGARSRYPKAFWVERTAYWLKWTLPALLLAVGFILRKAASAGSLKDRTGQFTHVATG